MRALPLRVVWLVAAAIGLAAPVSAQTPEPVTFNQHIAPLLHSHCAQCHRPGGAGPFSLLTFAETAKRAAQLAAVTGSGFMPPWKADGHPDEFVAQPRLTPDEVARFARWAAAPVEGQGKAPAPPTWPAGWYLGQPDLIVTLPAGYTLPGEPSDVFRIFAVPLKVSGTKYVRGIEFHPGNPRVVHHANIRIDRTNGSRRLDDADPAPGYDGLMARSAEYPDGHFLGWTPGQIAPLVDGDLAWRLDPGTDLVVQLHMQPSGKAEPVQPVIGFYFGDRPATRTPSILRLGSQGIDIPPGDGQYVVEDRYTLPVNTTLLAVQPHAHYRAKDVTGTATAGRPSSSAMTPASSCSSVSSGLESSIVSRPMRSSPVIFAWTSVPSTVRSASLSVESWNHRSPISSNDFWPQRTRAVGTWGLRGFSGELS